MQLTKSEYMLFLKHPAWLWLKKHDKAKLPAVDENTQAMFDAGNSFEPLVESLFPGGVRLGFENYDEYRSLPKRTKQALADGAKTLFQAGFEHEGLVFIGDIIQLVKPGVVDLTEIKSSTGVKDDHIFDLAFQMVVLEGCGFKVRKIAVAHVNNSYVRDGEIEAEKIVTISDVTKDVKAKRQMTKKYIDEAWKVVKSSKMPNPSPRYARLNSFKEWLKVYQNIKGEDFEEDGVLKLCCMGAKLFGELEDLNIKKLIDIPTDFKLNKKQTCQLKAIRKGQVILDKRKIKDFLDSLVYPLYFFDYETMMSLVPYFDGMSPYRQYPFQYSLHVMESPGGEVLHYEYLHKAKSNPVLGLSQTLKKQIGKKGSILTWNMCFEKNCNDLIGKMLPDYAEFYKSLNDRIVDLMIPFSNGWYIDKAFGGSASIKEVLPVMVPGLSYKELDIHEGSMAQRLWMKAVLDEAIDEEKDKVLDDLLKYCQLDTLAMVEIYKRLLKL